MWCYLFLIFLQISPAGGENDAPSGQNHYIVSHFTTADGLPVNNVTQFAQDSHGYLYAATYDGLVRYDGYQFRVVNTTNSPLLPSNRIAAIHYFPQKGLLLSHGNSQQSLFKQTGISVLNPPPRVPEDQLQYHVTTPDSSIWLKSANGFARLTAKNTLEPVTWITSHDASLLTAPYSAEAFFVLDETGLHKQERSGNTELLLPAGRFPFPAESAFHIIRTNDGRIWIICRNGMFGFIEGEETISSSIESEEPLEFWSYRHIDPDRILFFFRTGYYEAQLSTGTLEKMPIEVNADVSTNQQTTNRAFRTPDGELVLIGDDEVTVNGQIIFSPEFINSGFVDREGAIWISVPQEGIYRLRKSDVKNITTLHSRPVRNVYPIVQDRDGAIWLGTFSGGIFRTDPSGASTNWTEENSSLPTSIIRSLYVHPSGEIYAGLWDQGLWKWNGETWIEISEYRALMDEEISHVRSMFEDSWGRFFIGNERELVVREGDTYSFFTDASGRQLTGVWTIREDDSGNLFFATRDSGVAMLNRDHAISFINETHGLSSNRIRDIYLHSSDTLFVASEDRGLNRVILDSDLSVLEVTSLSTSDGLLNNSLHRIIPDRFQNIWISSNRGIMALSIPVLNRFLDDETTPLPIRSFTKAEGMVNSEANGGVQSAGILTSGGELWFPNQAGVTVLNPAEITSERNRRQPLPVIEQVAYDDTVMTLFERERVELPKGKRNIRINYTAPAPASAESIRFRYRMEGMIEDWQPGNTLNTASITNLSSGTHRFVVQSYSDEQTFQEAAIFITVPPFYYETPLFFLLAAGFVLVLAYAGHQYRLRVLAQREKALEQRVDQQTRELQQAAEEKSRFFTGITHELKTPLSLILGPVDQILEHGKNESFLQTRQYLQMMRRNGYRLKYLVDQILDVTRLNAGAIRLTLRPADIGTLTRHIAGQFDSRLQQCQLRLDMTIKQVEEPVYLDRQAWEQIVTNLMSNAIKFSPDGERIILAIENRGDLVDLSIRDYGPGIPENDRERVFEYLYQAEGRESAGGTGIGLYLVRGLAERMGGSVTLRTEPGQGSTFTVTLQKGYQHFSEKDTVLHDPIQIEKPAEQMAEPVQKETEKRPSAVLDRILVVEDNGDFRAYLHSVLSGTYHVQLASEGGEALEKIEEYTPDLIISDVMMSGMGGLEFVDKLRKQTKYRHLPVIFLSAKGRIADMETGLSTGADIYLTKPVQSKMLLSQISAVLRRERILKNRKQDTADAGEPDLKTRIDTIVYRQLANPDLNINVLADALYMSRSRLYREWNKRFDEGVNEYIVDLRMNEARELIESHRFSVKQAARAVGYTNPNYFSTRFKKRFGTTPSGLKV